MDGVIRVNDSVVTDPAWDLRADRHPSTWSFQNTATMRITGDIVKYAFSIYVLFILCILVHLYISNLKLCVFSSRRPQYPPLSLRKLQYLIDLGRIDPTQPIDLTQLVNSRGVTIQPLKRDHGIQLVDEVCLKITFCQIGFGST